MTWRGICTGIALLAAAAATPCDAKARRPSHVPSFTIRLLSTIPERRRTLTMAEFTRAMRACTFFEGRNPLRELGGKKAPYYSYGGLCRGTDALAPEVKVDVQRDERLIYITPDFSDAVIGKFAAALKAEDRAAMNALFGPAFHVLHFDDNGSPSHDEREGPQPFLAHLDRLKARYGKVTDALCRKRRFVMPGSYTPMYNCWLYFERLPEESRIWFQPDASEDGIDTLTIEDRPPFGVSDSVAAGRAPGDEHP